MPIIMLGLSHQRADLDALAQFAAAIPEATKRLSEAAGVHGLITLVTCNRCEFYLDAERFHSTVHLARQILTELAAGPGLNRLQAKASSAAVKHLFSVACGLDSMVIGEAEIIGQVRHALTSAHHDSPQLHRLFQWALSIAKDVTSAAGLTRIGRNLATVGLDLVGANQASQALLIGTGAYAGIVSAELVRRGVKTLVYSPSGRAENFAQTHLVTPVYDLAEALNEVSLVVCSSGNGQVVDAWQIQRLSRPIRLLDLSLQRDIDPGVKTLDGVELVDLDVIATHVPSNDYQQLAAAQQLIAQAVGEFVTHERSRDADQAVKAVRSYVDEIVAGEVKKAEKLDPQTADQVRRALKRVENALLHIPSTRAALFAQNGQLDDYTRAVQTVFGIDLAKDHHDDD